MLIYQSLKMRRYNKMQSQQTIHEIDDRVMGMEKQLFSFLHLKYQQKDIQINSAESIHTVFVPAQINTSTCQNYYIGHGFGGSSFMNFQFLQPLLKKGNVIFWEIRGMGLSNKLENYDQRRVEDIQAYFLKTIQALFSYYNNKNCTFICHSFSSYLVLLFCVRFPQLSKRHIKKLLLLSPIGITTKQEDYKNYINSCSDVLHTLLNKFGWAFSLTYKSLLRTICCCCKKSIIMSGVKDIQMPQAHKELICKIVQTLVLLPDGSEPLFFNFFEPRVIPKVAIEPLLLVDPLLDIILVYGGQQDWVDKTGAKKISERFPKSIRLVNLKDCGHNIPFDINICKQLFSQYL